MVKKTELIGYCGLYCGTCPSYTQVAADLARDLRNELRKGKFDKAADFLAKMPAFAAFKNYKEGYGLLGAIMKIRCKHGFCRPGGWDSRCKIRRCARQKKLVGCWQCDEFESCSKLKALEVTGDTTHLKNLRKIRRLGPARFVREVGGS
jgi:hypothetical protein